VGYGMNFNRHQKMKSMNESNYIPKNTELEEKLIWFASLQEKVAEYRELTALLNGPDRLYDPEGVRNDIKQLEQQLLFHLPTRYRAKYKI